jgi:glutaminyl-tRNA synthetase
VKGTIHWVSAAHAIDAECRLYDRLFTEAEPEKDGRDFKSVLNPHSLEVVTAKCEPSLKEAKPELRYQFERLAYFALDKDSLVGSSRRDDRNERTAGPAVPTLIFNRTITLKDTWAKEAHKS